MEKLFTKFFRQLLSIVPYGIEMAEADSLEAQKQLSIVPYGIEIV